MTSVDIVILTIWMSVSWLHIEVTVTTTPVSIMTKSYCSLDDEGAYLGLVLVVYKCIMLIFGCFLAMQTRKIKAKSFNEAKYIAMAIYVVFLISITGLPLAVFMLIERVIIWSFVTITLTIVGLSSVISCTVFIPKIYYLYKTRNTTMDALSTSLKKETSSNNYREMFKRESIITMSRKSSTDLLNSSRTTTSSLASFTLNACNGSYENNSTINTIRLEPISEQESPMDDDKIEGYV
jgi:hypothetical protein